MISPESLGNKYEDTKENVKSTRAKKYCSNDKSEAGQESKYGPNLEQKENENLESVKENNYPKRRKNRYVRLMR